jgi:hypothetical protein
MNCRTAKLCLSGYSRILETRLVTNGSTIGTIGTILGHYRIVRFSTAESHSHFRSATTCGPERRVGVVEKHLLLKV